MDQALAATLLADGVVTADEVAAQQARSVRAQKLARRWTVKVRRLQQRLRSLAADRRVEPARPVEAAHRDRRQEVRRQRGRPASHDDAGVRRPADGRQRTYKGLFQYYPSTWAGSWNPWRHESIYNGWAQIRATAYALSRGMGPSQWPNTYPMAF